MGIVLITAHHEGLPRSIVLAIEGTPDSSYNIESFSYEGEWASA